MWWHHTFVGFWETSNSKNWKRVQETTNPPSVRNLWLDMPRLLVRLLARNHCIFGSFLHQNLRPLSFQQCKPTNKTITKLVLRHHLWWYFTTETKSINETKDQDLTPGKLLFEPQRSPTQNSASTQPRPTGIPNPSRSANPGRNFSVKKPVEFTPIPMPYVDLLPSLIANQMAVVSLRKIF